MHSRQCVVVIYLMFMSALALCQQQNMTHEEEIVRRTYARLAFASQVAEIHNQLRDKRVNKAKALDATDFNLRMTFNTVRFELSGFKVGPLSEIAQTKYSDVVTPPAGTLDSLSVAPGHFVYSHNGVELKSPTAEARWVKSQNVTYDWGQPFAALYAKSELAGQHTRYAAFHVQVTFQGRARDYSALFLFGQDPNTGNDIIFPEDMVIEVYGGAITRFIIEDAYPTTLIEGQLGNSDPLVREWLRSGQHTGTTGKANCDLVNLRCGVHPDDVRKLDQPKPTSRET